MCLALAPSASLSVVGEDKPTPATKSKSEPSAIGGPRKTVERHQPKTIKRDSTNRTFGNKRFYTLQGNSEACSIAPYAKVAQRKPTTK